MGGITKSVRRKITKEILIGTGARNHLAGIFSAAATTIDPAHDLSLAAININTLRSFSVLVVMKMLKIRQC